ncbi:putative signaling protein [Sphingobium sp. SYK-6]|uniref:PAS domain S-box protein n=1 Tax=Sphingobium sp. (strain NBRC 103272 / SYK-6) TaxID=627192 RepID=UPI0002276675|nr:PAS domain S-box protein [Sphingobium sp. SYK-6]BAK65720.1 putative signaling protein [Sphingobium sp. SYK-6]
MGTRQETVQSHRTAEGLPQDAGVLSLLYRYTDQLYRAKTLDAIYDAALSAICDGLETDRASILRFDDEGVMRFVASRGLSQAYRQAVDGHSPWEAGARNAEIISIEDIAQSGESPEIIAAIRKEDIRALCFIPLAPDNRVIGKFMVYYRDARTLGRDKCELALTIARQLGFALQKHEADHAARHLAALVDGSNDAIISKTLDGIITSWNAGATGLFGYTARETIGKPILMLIPEDRRTEEDEILAAIRAGKRVSSYETVRRRKDGQLLDLSLTISPVKDNDGRIVGASKIARDISERRRHAEAQALLLAEMNHRVKNAYALTSSLLLLSARTTKDADTLAKMVADRLAALARAHSLTLPSAASGEGDKRPDSLQSVLAATLAPFEGSTDAGVPRLVISGDDAPVPDRLVTSLALLFHELATNATKYGSLSVPGGRVELSVRGSEQETEISWLELGGPATSMPAEKGFGSRLLDLAARELGAIERRWEVDGLRVILRMARTEDSNPAPVNDSAAIP